jgi:transketolase
MNHKFIQFNDKSHISDPFEEGIIGAHAMADVAGVSIMIHFRYEVGQDGKFKKSVDEVVPVNSLNEVNQWVSQNNIENKSILEYAAEKFK